MSSVSDSANKRIQSLAELYQCHITLTRGAKKEYRWDVSLRDNDDVKCLERIKKINEVLVATFGDISE